MALTKIHSTKFDAQTDRSLKLVSKIFGTPISNIIREATKKHVEQLKQQAIFLKEGQDALEHINKTGLHLTEDEINTWLDSWGTDNELKRPKCHV
jgi:predicted transcriptional regulator